MDNLGQDKKILKLSDNDKKILLAYSDTLDEPQAKPTSGATLDNDIFIF